MHSIALLGHNTHFTVQYVHAGPVQESEEGQLLFHRVVILLFIFKGSSSVSVCECVSFQMISNMCDSGILLTKCSDTGRVRNI